MYVVGVVTPRSNFSNVPQKCSCTTTELSVLAKGIKVVNPNTRREMRRQTKMRKHLKPAAASFVTLIMALIMSVVGIQTANAEEVPTGETASSEVVVTTEEAQAPVVADETPVELPAVTESAPAPEQPAEVAPAQPADAESAKVAPVPAEDTQPSPPEEQVVVDNSEADAPEALTSKPHEPVEKCVTLSKKNTTHTFNEATGATTVVVSGKAGTPVCNPLYIVIVPFAYLVANSVWPQEDVGRDNPTRIYVDKVGSYSATPLLIKDCRQYDSYASFKSWEDATPPSILKGAGNPYEPDFLHQYSTGPTTYHATSAHGCAGKPEVPGPKVTTTGVTEEKFVCGDALVNRSETITTTYFKVVFVNGKFEIVIDESKTTVVTVPSTRALTPEEIESCKPVVPETKVVEKIVSTEECVPGKATVTQTFTVSRTAYTAVLVSGSTWDIFSDTTIKTDTREIALTQSQLEACNPVIVPPTVIPAGTPPAPLKAAPAPPKPPVLASTGAETGGPLTIAALLLLVGTAFSVNHAMRRRRNSTNE